MDDMARSPASPLGAGLCVAGGVADCLRAGFVEAPDRQSSKMGAIPESLEDVAAHSHNRGVGRSIGCGYVERTEGRGSQLHMCPGMSLRRSMRSKASQCLNRRRRTIGRMGEIRVGQC